MLRIEARNERAAIRRLLRLAQSDSAQREDAPPPRRRLDSWEVAVIAFSLGWLFGEVLMLWLLG